MPNTYQYRSPLFDSMPNRSRFANRQDSQPVQMINGQSYNQPGIIPMYDNQAVQATTRPRNHHYVRHQQVPTSQSFSSPELAQTPPRQSIQPLQPKLAPQASVSPAKRLELNLKVIQRHDPTIYRILDQIPYAILYKYTILRDPDGSNASGSWEKSEMEGSMFIFERREQPRYGFFILNRSGLGNLVQNFHKDDQFELSDDEKYIIYRASGKLPNNGNVNSSSNNEPSAVPVKPIRPSPVGLWLSDPHARKRVTEFIMKLRAHIQRTDSPMEFDEPASNSRMNADTAASTGIVSASEERTLDRLFAPFLTASNEIDLASPPPPTLDQKPPASDLTGQALLASMFQSAANSQSDLAPPVHSSKGKGKGKAKEIPSSGSNVLDQMFAAARAQADAIPMFNQANIPVPPSWTSIDTERLGRLLGMSESEMSHGAEGDLDNSETVGSDQPYTDEDDLMYPLSPTPQHVSQHIPIEDLLVPLESKPRSSAKDINKSKSSKRFRPQNEQYIPQNSAHSSKLDREYVVDAVGDALESVEGNGLVNNVGHENALERNDFVRELLTLIHIDGSFVDELFDGYLRKLQASNPNNAATDDSDRRGKTRRSRRR